MSQPFNTYKHGLDLAFLRDYCVERGELVRYKRGDAFAMANDSLHGIGYVKHGCFKYVVHNEDERKDYITGFAFQNEFVADFPNCITRNPPCVSILAITSSEVYLIDGHRAAILFETNERLRNVTGEIYKHLFLQTYSQYLDFYRTTPKERYVQLLRRCPQIVQQINLKDIASYLKVTPTTISKIRKEITFSR